MPRRSRGGPGTGIHALSNNQAHPVERFIRSGSSSSANVDAPELQLINSTTTPVNTYNVVGQC